MSTLSQGRSLEEFTRAQLEVDCGGYQCVSINRSDCVYLNDQGQHSRDVQLSLEEVTFTQSGLHRRVKSQYREQSVNLRSVRKVGLDTSKSPIPDLSRLLPRLNQN